MEYMNANIMFNKGERLSLCAPSSVTAAYNSITAPKLSYIVPETGHWDFLEQAIKE